MNLTQVKHQLEKKDQKRNQLLGQKKALTDSLKKLDISSIEAGEKEIEKLETELLKKKEIYKQKVKEFINEFQSLLED